MKNFLLGILLFSSGIQAVPSVLTFINTTQHNIQLEVHFSDNSIVTKGVAMSQSYQVVNFDKKKVNSIIFSSTDKDKNGNLFGQLDQKFTDIKADTTYHIALESVPAHKVPAGAGTDEFEMPETQKIICTVAPSKDSTSSKVATKK